MACERVQRRTHEGFDALKTPIEVAEAELEDGSSTDVDEEEQNAGQLENDHESGSEQSEESEVPQSVVEDIARFEESFKGITKQYKIIDRIGEGTFSTVYKAEDLLYDQHLNDWDISASETECSTPQRIRSNLRSGRRKRYVAIKKIYVTSSPSRIQNELELLYDLRDCKAICPLITAFRHHDQVIAVLPYYSHRDFRDYYRSMRPVDIRSYFRSLFVGLAAVHKHGILHRDIKPTNFLYDPRRGEGVLVDFGLAERFGTDWSYCMCFDNPERRRQRLHASHAANNDIPEGYPKNDTRPSRRANRAGTRGFRAPEVLFKCTNQSYKIDIWSAGVILLTILGQRFPFFNSADDIDAMVEMSSTFGKKKMQHCAILHGTTFMCTVPTVGDKGHSLEKLILWSRCKKQLKEGEREAVNLLEKLLEVDVRKRVSAKEALQHEFFNDPSAAPSVDSTEIEELDMTDA